MRLMNDHYLLNYQDDGVGFSDTNGHEIDHHFGHFLIEGFADQLDGTIQKKPSETGVHFELAFA